MKHDTKCKTSKSTQAYQTVNLSSFSQQNLCKNIRKLTKNVQELLAKNYSPEFYSVRNLFARIFRALYLLFQIENGTFWQKSPFLVAKMIFAEEIIALSNDRPSFFAEKSTF